MSDLAQRSNDRRTPAKVSPQDTVAAMIARQRDEIMRAMPKSLDPDRFARMVLTEVKGNPGLLKCEPVSLLAATMKAASLGLEPGPLEHVYLVPRGNKVTLSIWYKGIIALARRSGQIASLYAEVVYDGDEFDYQLGLHRDIKHKRGTQRGEVKYAYAVAQYKDGGFDFVVLDELDIDARRRASSTPNAGPWKDNFEAMARKSAVRALAPYLPLSAEVAGAVQGRADERIYDWDSIDTEGVEVEPEPVGTVEHIPEREDQQPELAS